MDTTYVSPLGETEHPERGTAGETKVCRWVEAGNNGEPHFIYEDGSPAPLHHIVSLNWDDYPIPEGKEAKINPNYRQWQAGWYPVEESS